MKKTLIALAALAASSAFAQSSVTLFGTVDLGMGAVSRDVSNNNGTGTAHNRSTQLGGVNSSNATNAIGFRGVEDLGSGLKAGFSLIFATKLDNVSANGAPTASSATSGGNNGTPFAQTREANVYVGGDFGRFVIGSQLTPGFYYAAAPFALQDTAIGGSFLPTMKGAAVGRGPLGLLSAGATRNANIQTNGQYLAPFDGVTGQQPRYENVLTYATPDLSGFVGAVSVIGTQSVTTGTATGAPIAASTSKLNGQLYQANYANGPLIARISYLNVKQESLTASRKVSSWLANVSYDFGPAAAWGSYEAGKNANQLAAGRLHSTAWEIGVKVPVGAAAPYFLYGKGSLDNTAAFGPTNSVGGNTIGIGSVDAKSYQLGVKYSLSKRSTLWGGYGQSKYDRAATGDSDKQGGYRLGITHTF